MKQLLVLFLLGLSSCTTPSELANRRLTTEKFDAVSIGNFVSDDVIREIEKGLVSFVVETIKKQNPRAYRDLEQRGELDLRGYKRQYYPNPGAEGSFDSPPHEWRFVEVILVHADDPLVTDGSWLKWPLVVSDGWISFLYATYDLENRAFVSAHTGGFS